MNQIFPELCNDQAQFNNNQMQFNNGPMPFGYQMIPGPHMMGANFVPNFMQAQQFPGGPFPNYNQPFGMNQFNNQMMNPEMNQMNPMMASNLVSPVLVNPGPVPPPDRVPSPPAFSPKAERRTKYSVKQANENAKKTAQNNIQQAKKKVRQSIFSLQGIKLAI